ncbi:hypothetical protein CA14_004334 [Aspergillus flavus]|uniref:Cytochrome P450 n=1 Tax=Aspergillus flavus TaxID=5059 RepID=A0AB74CAY9_ASPFL|nr:hypothetical protein NYO67_10076 [Aspergillus flavus]RMZ43859.1 hypothetical protein CA14_004334 [Aspergillus flavus]
MSLPTALEYLQGLSPTMLWGLCLAGLLLTFILRAFYNVFLHPLARYPGPILWTSSVIPYQIALLRGTAHLHSAQLHERYGPVVRVSPNELSYITAKAWTDIYGRRHPEQLKKHPDITSAPAGGTHGLANTPSDDDHARIRRLMVSGFSERGVRAQEEFFTVHIDRLITKIKETVFSRLGTTGTEDQDTIDLTLLFHATTFDIITDLAFGESADTLQKGTDWISLTMPLARGRIMHIVASSYSSLIIPIMRKLFPGIVPNAAIQYFENTVASLDRRLAQGTGDNSRPDLLQPVLPHLNSPKGLSLGELQSTMRSLMIAGSETSASILTSAHYFTLSNPRIYRRLQVEIRSRFTTGDEINSVTVNQCKYLVAVLQETMRLWPAIAISLPRVTPPEGCEIDGSWVPGGTKVGVSQWSAYRSERNFARADQFLPERWLPEGEEESFINDNRAAFQPFSTGPRNCLGMNFARAETRIIFARLLLDFDLELLTGRDEWEAQKVYIIWDRCPLYVRVRQAKRR